MTVRADDPFLGVARISRNGFAAELNAFPANRQVLDERDARAYWDEACAWGVDPLFLLAMFQHESSMGKAGTATQTHSWGNTRSPTFGAVPVDEAEGRSGVFPVFHSWLGGIASTAARLASPVWPLQAPYGGRTSIRQVFEHPSGAVWAPAGDLNDPGGYLNAMLAAMNLYTDQDDVALGGPFNDPTPPVYLDYLEGNYSVGRGGREPLALLLHITQSEAAAGTINWFKNPAAQVSCHYIVDRDGTIVALVRERDTAWINGKLAGPNTSIPVVRRWVTQSINPNAETIGVEVVGYSPAQPKEGRPDLTGYTDRQMAALAFLLPAIGWRRGIDLAPDWCFGHREIDSVNRKDCPGLTDAEWAEVWAMDAAEIETPNDAFDAWCDAHGDSALWAGQIVGKAHWYGRDPLDLCRTTSGRLLAYDGAKAQDATAWEMDEWEEASKAGGQLTIWGQETPPDPEPPQPDVPVGAAWPIHPGDGAALTGAEQTFLWGRDASQADVEIIDAAGAFVDGWSYTEATSMVATMPGAGEYQWTLRGRDGERVSQPTIARFTVASAPEPEPPDPPKPPDTTPYPPVVTPTYQEGPTAATWRNVSDQKIDLAVSRRWRPDCDGGVGPWPDTAQWLEPSFPGANTAASPLELRKLARRLSIHPPIVEAAWRHGLWARVPAIYTVQGSEWEDDATTDYGEKWSSMPAQAQTWASQVCTLGTAIQRASTLAQAFALLGMNEVEARAWAARYHCLRRRVRDLSELAGC